MTKMLARDYRLHPDLCFSSSLPYLIVRAAAIWWGAHFRQNRTSATFLLFRATFIRTLLARKPRASADFNNSTMRMSPC